MSKDIFRDFGLKNIDLEPIIGARLFSVHYSVVYEFGQCAQRTGSSYEVVSTKSCEVNNRSVVLSEGFSLLRLFRGEGYLGQKVPDFNNEFNLSKRIEQHLIYEF